MNKLQEFINLVAAKMGLKIREPSVNSFQRLISKRISSLKLEDSDYYRLLTEGSVQGDIEWELLADLLTINETYFFRDQEQIATISQKILPELIERQKEQRSLRIWSAGCSSGEEPYTLAILIHELLPRREDWDILILGTDINKRALDKAKQGSYGKWSFRSYCRDPRPNYFRERNGEWVIDERIRSMVTFRALNLFENTFPAPGTELSELDLIVCRNVFIYFDRDTVMNISQRFAHSLKQDAYLVLGRAEMSCLQIPGLTTKAFPKATVYYRSGQKNIQAPIKKTPKAQMDYSALHNQEQQMQEQQQLLRKKIQEFQAFERGEQVIEVKNVQQLPPPHPSQDLQNLLDIAVKIQSVNNLLEKTKDMECETSTDVEKRSFAAIGSKLVEDLSKESIKKQTTKTQPPGKILKGSAKKVIVISAEDLNLQLAKYVFTKADYQVWGARNFQEASRHIKQQKIEVALLDIVMPGMKGLNIARSLKADPFTMNVIIVAWSTLIRCEERKIAEEAGCEGYIQKPVAPEELVSQLRMCMLQAKAKSRL